MIFLFNNKKVIHQSGQTIVEVIIAIAVGALVMTAVVATMIVTISNAQFAKEKTQAIKYLDEGVENVRIARDTANSWEIFLSDYASPQQETVGNGVYTRTTTVTQGMLPNDNQATVAVTVSWIGAKGTHQVSSASMVGKWE